MKKFLSILNFLNLNNASIRNGSCTNEILTNRKYFFQNTTSYETRLGPHHHLIYSVLKIASSLEEPKN